ncbi:uncharacterized protein LOC111013504 [Momordica charantia]|uniref:Uncharacterized protein LOC111013504 n=1 Tax=Momordica charantia TaxID=3673 RepID=A0A6J1CR75_MOMCH|nr:uncharacterized protein LOC111013504 [Momordica charantia]
MVKRVLIDVGASTNVLSLSVYSALRWERDQLKPSSTPLVGFAGESVTVEGCSSLPVTLGEGEHQVTSIVEFMVIDRTSAYNTILGRPFIHQLKAIPSTYHQMMKYLTASRMATIRGEYETLRECYAAALKGTAICATITVEAPLPDEPTRGTLVKEVELVPLLSPDK